MGEDTRANVFAYLIQGGVITPLTGTTDITHMKQDLEVFEMELLNGEERKIFDLLIEQ